MLTWILKRVNHFTEHIDDLTSLEQIKDSHDTSVVFFGDKTEPDYDTFR